MAEIPLVLRGQVRHSLVPPSATGLARLRRPRQSTNALASNLPAATTGLVRSAPRPLLVSSIAGRRDRAIPSTRHFRATTFRKLGGRLLGFLHRRNNLAARNVILSAARRSDPHTWTGNPGGPRSSDCTNDIVVTEISRAIDHLSHPLSCFFPY